MEYTVNHAIRGTQYGARFGNRTQAEKHAQELSATVTHTIDVFEISNARKLVAWAYKGNITRVEGTD